MVKRDPSQEHTLGKSEALLFNFPQVFLSRKALDL